MPQREREGEGVLKHFINWGGGENAVFGGVAVPCIKQMVLGVLLWLCMRMNFASNQFSPQQGIFPDVRVVVAA